MKRFCKMAPASSFVKEERGRRIKEKSQIFFFFFFPPFFFVVPSPSHPFLLCSFF